jgi:cell division protein FtsA
MGDTVRTRMNGSKPNGIKAPQARTGLIAALDVGSSKIACVIGRAEAQGLRVLGSALHESHGIKSGAVTQLDLADQSIRKAVDAAEQLADQRIQDVIISVQCGQPKSMNSRVERAVGGVLLNDTHLRELLGEAKRHCRDEGYEAIQAAATGYMIDSVRGVADPRGMFCERLGVSVHAVAVRAGPLHNLRIAVERCHLSIARQLYAAYASGLATLAPDETSLGVTLLDMGAGCTSVAIFRENALVHVDSVPLGGAHVTADIARILSAPLGAAERIKTLYGSALGALEAGSDTIEVPLMGEEGERGSKRIKRALLTHIIQDRMEEIFGELQSKLKKDGFDVAAGRRAVLTGGASQLAGVSELATRMLGKQIRLARPQTFAGLAAATAGPAYATALGLLIAGANSSAEAQDPRPRVQPKPERRGLVRWLAPSLFGQ